MSTLAEIPVRIEPSGTDGGEGTVGGGVAAILSEIATLLERLARTGESGAIDVRSLPISAADRAELVKALGVGELDIHLQANGESRILETAIHGVWWTEHRDTHGALLATLIEVARVPDILIVGDEDLARGASRLRTSRTPLSAAQGESPHGTT